MAFKSYWAGAEVLGDGGALPWMSLISNIAQGVTGVTNDGSAKKPAEVQAAVQKAVAEEKKRQETEKAQSRRTMLYVGLGAVGVAGAVGVTALIVRRKK